MVSKDLNVTVTAADIGKTVDIRQGERVNVKLEENATTGYRWAIDRIEEGVLELEDSDFVLASDTGIGGGGERIFRFRAKSTGTSHVQLKMQREWEGDVPPIQRYDFSIRVE